MSTQALESKSRLPQSPTGVVPRTGGAPHDGRRGGAQHRPGVHDPNAARAVVIAVIHRIEGYLDEKTAALDATPNFDLRASNDRKSQGLVDLNQAMRRLKNGDVNQELEIRLQAFRGKLAINLRKIRLHLEAVKEITAMLSDAIQSAESDGTYTRQIGPPRSGM